jgi:hypothetical protein
MKNSTTAGIYPVPDIPDYAVRDDGAVIKLDNGISSRGVPKTKVTFSQAMQIVGNRIALHRTPFPLIAGVWQMRFGGDIGTGEFLGSVSVADYLRRHGFGPNRVHPATWPDWPAAADAAAASFTDESAPEWCVLTHLTSESERLRAHVKHFDLPSEELLRAPVIILAPVALIAIRSKLTSSTE